MSEPPPLPQRKSEREPVPLDMPAGLGPPLAPALPMMAPPPLPPRKSAAVVMTEEMAPLQLDSKAFISTGRVDPGPQGGSTQDPRISEIPTSLIVTDPEISESSTVVSLESSAVQPPQSSQRDVPDAQSAASPQSYSNAATNQEVEVPQELHQGMPSVPEPNTPASRRTQASAPVTPKSSAIPLSATTQGRKSTPPVSAEIAAKRASTKGPFTPAPLAPNQDPHIPLPMPSLPVVLLLPIPITLAYLRVSFITLILGLLFSWYIWAEWKRKKTKRTDFGPEVDRDRVKGLNAKWEHERYNEESVGWMNHALAALFPLINTDILTPFIDLVEDALLTQVPPIVVSVKRRSAITS